MALKFKGRLGVENYVEQVEQEDGSFVSENRQKPAQQFMSGIMVFKEKVPAKIPKGKEPALSKEGKPLLDGKGQPVMKEVFADGFEELKHVFRPGDIGKAYDKFKDEAAVLAANPLSFDKA